MSRMGGSADGAIGTALTWWGVITLTCGLYLMFELIAQQQALIQKLTAERQASA
jgi:hypothetical protein